MSMFSTEDQRRSTLGVWGFMRVLPVPTTNLTRGDRQHLWLYRFDDDEVALGAGGDPRGEKRRRPSLGRRVAAQREADLRAENMRRIAALTASIELTED